MAKEAFNKKEGSFHPQIFLNLRNKLVQCYVWNMALYDAEK